MIVACRHLKEEHLKALRASLAALATEDIALLLHVGATIVGMDDVLILRPFAHFIAV